jgi:uncharacterized membrane protein YraQ (UPF0718 family)
MQQARSTQPTPPSLRSLLLATLRDAVRILPLFSLAVLVSTALELFVPRDWVYSILGQNLLVAITLATIAGILLPIPRYATYPIALALYEKGATLGVVYALIAGEVILGSLERDIMEFQFFGSRSYVLRLLLCTVFVILTAVGLEVLL